MSSSNRQFEIKDARFGAAFAVRVVTRAKQTGLLTRRDDGALTIHLMAPSFADPVANEELLNFLATELGIQRHQIQIVAGAGARDKILSIEGVTSAQVEAQLARLSGG